MTETLLLPARLKVADCDCDLELLVEYEYDEDGGYYTVHDVTHEGQSLSLPDSMLGNIAKELSTLKLGD